MTRKFSMTVEEDGVGGSICKQHSVAKTSNVEVKVASSHHLIFQNH